jgi:predicted ABC-type ATPase
VARLRDSDIYVLAGPNGAGKSSVAGAVFRASGADYFNPDEAARKILRQHPDLTQLEANSLAWQEGRRLLEEAIESRKDFAFETTLGGRTITDLLERALAARIGVHLWYIALHSAELHIARVQSRVDHGGHNIPEAQIRSRYASSILNLIRLMPGLKELQLYDNSATGDPQLGQEPQPLLVLSMAEGKIQTICDLDHAPDWAKPILAAALRISQ